MVPWWAQVHIFGGFVGFFWILTPILYYTNVSGSVSLTFFFEFEFSSNFSVVLGADAVCKTKAEILGGMGVGNG